MPGLNLILGGRMDPTFRGSLTQSVAEAKAAGLAIQNALRMDITRQQKTIGGLTSADAAEIIGRSRYISQQQLKLRLTQSAQERALNQADVAARMAAEAEKVAAVKASQLAMLTSIAARGTVVEGLGHGGGPGGGLSGIMRETLVIIRELGRGNLTRVPGSVTLLAQYLGVLGKLVKSTAADAVVAAAGEDRLAASMARSALGAEAKASAARRAAAAETVDIEAANALVAANERLALSAREAAVAQAAKATAAQTAAKIETAAASVTISPLGWTAAAVVALGAAAFFTWRHFHTLAVESRNLASLLDPLKKKFSEQADALRDDAKEHQAFLDFLKKVGAEAETLPEKLERIIKAMREEAKAEQELARLRGATKLEVERMEEAELAAELEMATRMKLQAQREAELAQIAAEEADKAFTSNPSEGGIDLLGAERVKKNAGEILNAIQDAMDSSFGKAEIGRFREVGKKTPIGEEEAGYVNMRQGANTLTGKETAEQAIAIIQSVLDKSAFTATVQGKKVRSTVSDAQAAYTKATAEADHLTNIQKELADTLSNTKTTYQEKQRDLQRLTKEASDIMDQLGIKKKYGSQIASLEGGAGGRREATERERVGLGSPQVALLDVNRKMEGHLRYIRDQFQNPASGLSKEHIRTGGHRYTTSWQNPDLGGF